MGWYEELKKSLGEAARQVVGSRTKHTPYVRVTTKTLRFTNKFTQEATARELMEKDAEDV
jgi:hypothetical protein